MKIDLNNAVTIIVGLFTIVTAIYQLAGIESNINSRIAKIENNLLIAIDSLKDNFSDKLHTTEKKLDVHLTEYAEKKLFLDYRMNDIDKRIEHKFNRLANWIKQITGFLNEESNFQIRDDQF